MALGARTYTMDRTETQVASPQNYGDLLESIDLPRTTQNFSTPKDLASIEGTGDYLPILPPYCFA